MGFLILILLDFGNFGGSGLALLLVLLAPGVSGDLAVCAGWDLGICQVVLDVLRSFLDPAWHELFFSPLGLIWVYLVDCYLF